MSSIIFSAETKFDNDKTLHLISKNNRFEKIHGKSCDLERVCEPNVARGVSEPY